MKLIETNIEKICDESEIFESILSLDGKNILELGCGGAETTRVIATNGHDRKMTATEVDKIQHEKNLLINDLPNVKFELAGSQDIPSNDNTFDVVFMFKSLHHVPYELMEKALKEVKRVLKPGGMAYISEPVFAGEFNEILRIFNNEEEKRQKAFNAIEKVVNCGNFTLKDELFFKTPVVFENFEAFDNKVVSVTFNEYDISSEMMKKIKDKFSQYMTPDGARFEAPIRVDLLEKKNSFL